MDNNEKDNTKKKKQIKIGWWLILVAIVVFGSVWYLVSQSLDEKVINKKDTATDIKLKQNISSLRGDISRHFDDKKTYKGWTPSNSAAENLSKIGSEIKTGDLTDSTYMVYAQEPDSKIYFCIDNTGFTGELTKISSKQKSCK